MNLNQVFSPDNLFWKLISKAVDFVGLSLFWILLSLPVVTVGPATCGLYRAVTKSLRKWEDEGAFSIMWRGFRENLKKGILATVCFEVLGLLLGYGYMVMRANWGSNLGAVMFVTYDLALFIPIGMVIFFFPTMANFSQSLKEYFVNSLFLTIRHFPSSIVLVLLYIEMVIFVLEKWAPILFAPSLLMLLTSFFLERIYKKYPVDSSYNSDSATGLADYNNNDSTEE